MFETVAPVGMILVVQGRNGIEAKHAVLHRLWFPGPPSFLEELCRNVFWIRMRASDGNE